MNRLKFNNNLTFNQINYDIVLNYEYDLINIKVCDDFMNYYKQNISDNKKIFW